MLGWHGHEEYGCVHASRLVELLLEAAVVGKEGEAVCLASVLAERVVPSPLNPAAARGRDAAQHGHTEAHSR